MNRSDSEVAIEAVEEGRGSEASLPGSGVHTSTQPSRSPPSTLSKAIASVQNAARHIWPELRDRTTEYFSDKVSRQGDPDPMIVRQLEDCPEGYPRLATFLNSDDSFSIYRGFGYLQSRLILEKQNELEILEEKVDRMDIRDAEQNNRSLHTRAFHQENIPRSVLLREAEKRFGEYTNLLSAAQQMRSFNKPASKDRRSVKNYLNNTRPLVDKEAQWIRHQDDLITLRHSNEYAWLDSQIEHGLDLMPRTLGARRLAQYFFSTPASRTKSQDSLITYYELPRVQHVANFVFMLVILALLIIPIYVLYRLVVNGGTSQSYSACIGVLFAFTLLLSASMSLFTKAKRQEILGAAAAYCAVLVVFLGNVGSNAS